MSAECITAQQVNRSNPPILVWSNQSINQSSISVVITESVTLTRLYFKCNMIFLYLKFVLAPNYYFASTTAGHHHIVNGLCTSLNHPSSSRFLRACLVCLPFYTLDSQQVPQSIGFIVLDFIKPDTVRVGRPTWSKDPCILPLSHLSRLRMSCTQLFAAFYLVDRWEYKLVESAGAAMPGVSALPAYSTGGPYV